jgi:hypothetical protein
MTVEELIDRLKETPSHYEIIIAPPNDRWILGVTGAIIDTHLSIVILRAES